MEIADALVGDAAVQMDMAALLRRPAETAEVRYGRHTRWFHLPVKPVTARLKVVVTLGSHPGAASRWFCSNGH